MAAVQESGKCAKMKDSLVSFLVDEHLMTPHVEHGVDQLLWFVRLEAEFVQRHQFRVQQRSQARQRVRLHVSVRQETRQARTFSDVAKQLIQV